MPTPSFPVQYLAKRSGEFSTEAIRQPSYKKLSRRLSKSTAMPTIRVKSCSILGKTVAKRKCNTLCEMFHSQV
jgi:uncharacterized membrane protein YbaN (DUF454 family)